MNAPPIIAPRAAGQRPWLLVSVRSPKEAAVALAGGADIIDVKEPRHGSLGFAGADAITAIERELATKMVPLTAALGETIDWISDAARSAADVSLPQTLSYCKLGLAGLADDRNWIERWCEVRNRFAAASGGPRRWIAVVYADWQRCAAPAPEAVIEAAIATQAAGVLFDTCRKDGSRLTDCLTHEEFARYCRVIRERGLLLALAGGLRLESLPEACGLLPDVIAVRSAACKSGDRRGTVDEIAVTALKQALLCPG